MKILFIFFFIFQICVQAQCQTNIPCDLEHATNFRDSLGRRQGCWKYVDSMGNQLVAFIVNDTPQALLKSYTPDGMLEYKFFAKDGKKHGEFKKYFFNGKVEEEGCYDHGVRVGAYKTYEYTGKLYQEMYYINGVKWGNHYFYSADKKIVTIWNYENGNSDNTTKIYYKGYLAVEHRFEFIGDKYKCVMTYIYDKKGNVIETYNKDQDSKKSKTLKKILRH